LGAASPYLDGWRARSLVLDSITGRLARSTVYWAVERASPSSGL
jgi:hypothetical protein